MNTIHLYVHGYLSMYVNQCRHAFPQGIHVTPTIMVEIAATPVISVKKWACISYARVKIMNMKNMTCFEDGNRMEGDRIVIVVLAVVV